MRSAGPCGTPPSRGGRRRLRGGGHRRVPGRRGRLLLPRDEHPPPGRARRHRAGDRARSGRAAARGGRRATAALGPGGRRRRRVTPSRSGSARNGPGRTTGRPPARSPTSRWPERRRAPGRPGHRVGERGQRLLRFAGGQGHGARTGPGPGRGPPVLRPACARARRSRDQPGHARRPCSTTRPTASGAVDVHYLERRPDLRDAGLPDAVRHRHGAAAAAALLAERAAHSLVPVPAAGWRNVGQALHADALTDAAGAAGGPGIRAPAAGPGAGRRALAGRGHRRGRPPTRRARRPSISRRSTTGCAAAIGCATASTRRLRERPRGAVHLRPAHDRTTRTSVAGWRASAGPRCPAP